MELRLVLTSARHRFLSACAFLRIVLPLAALVFGLHPGAVAHALPAASYDVELISHAGATATSVRGVDSTGRVLGYWSFFSQPPPLQIGAEPDAGGYFLWENGVETPLTIPGLTNFNIHRMNVGGAMWGSSDQGSFIYQEGNLSIVQSQTTDVTLVQGVDAAGRVYGILGNYPPGVDPDDVIVPIDPVSSFVWEGGTFTDLDILLTDGTLHGVTQDGVLWGSNAEDSFVQDGTSLTVLDHSGYDYTGIRMLTADGDAFGFGLTSNAESFDSTDFFWDPIDGFQDWPDGQNLPGTSERPHSLNEAGIFWGSSVNGAFVATPVPEPATAFLVAAGLIGLALRGRRPLPARFMRLAPGSTSTRLRPRERRSRQARRSECDRSRGGRASSSRGHRRSTDRSIADRPANEWL